MRLRVATFNIENLDIGPEWPPIEARVPTLQAQLRRLNADIICLQEVNGQKLPGARARQLLALDAVVKHTGYESFQRASTINESSGGAYDVHNLVTLSRFPIRRIEQVLHMLVPPMTHRILFSPQTPAATDIRWDRPLLHTEIAVSETCRLHVINLHLRAPIASAVPGGKSSATTWRDTTAWAEGYFLAEMKRSGQALEARLLTDQILDKSHDAAILVCGDFNAEANDTALQILQASPEDTGNRDLAWRTLVPLENPGDDIRQFTVMHGGRGVMLDHILASATMALACRNVTIDNSALLDEVEPASVSSLRPGSYHAPVVAEFQLQTTSRVDGDPID
ncbi:MAG: endonuclease/exonuclease/phosphatase family protein [Dongiaceae bacterium]